MRSGHKVALTGLTSASFRDTKQIKIFTAFWPDSVEKSGRYKGFGFLKTK
jgi:hypothetical protein